MVFYGGTMYLYGVRGDGLSSLSGAGVLLLLTGLLGAILWSFLTAIWTNPGYARASFGSPASCYVLE